jgi:hypothetical protein
MRAISIVILCSLSSCSYINQQLGLPDDNTGEEIFEYMIEGHLGVDVDLTPGNK